MDIAPPSEVEGFTVDRDLSCGGYEVRGFGIDTRLREWTFGERRRLLRACVGSTGFDEGRFLEAFTQLVYSPAPPEGLRPLFAHLALSLFGVDDGPCLSQEEADLCLARELGVLPSRSDGESAPELDRLIRSLSAGSSPSVGSAAQPGSASKSNDGWTRILVVDDD